MFPKIYLYYIYTYSSVIPSLNFLKKIYASPPKYHLKSTFLSEITWLWVAITLPCWTHSTLPQRNQFWFTEWVFLRKRPRNRYSVKRYSNLMKCLRDHGMRQLLATENLLLLRNTLRARSRHQEYFQDQRRQRDLRLYTQRSLSCVNHRQIQNGLGWKRP